jgi:4-amino-4-deoxy-L-arabinose transferase-like glycosyltransferase
MPLLVLLGALLLAGLGMTLAEKWLRPYDFGARLGFGGLLGLGLLGTYTLAVGLLPQGLRWGWIGVILLCAAGIPALVKESRHLKSAPRPETTHFLAYAILGVGFLFALAGVLAPSTPNDWDSVAYHLAIPKLYLTGGQIAPIPFIHHSNFPSVVDLSFIWGLLVGGQAAAKAIILAYTAFGVLALGGVTRFIYGREAGLWAMVGFATVPVVLWESGTAYIDVAHGLFAGLGIVLALLGLQSNEKDKFGLSGLFLGLACASKYTGLQTLGVVVLILGVALLIRKKSLAPLGAVLGLSVAIAFPWYVKNVLWTGNPTYPFFYEVFHGRNWDQRRADIYAEEQRSFGVGLSKEGRAWPKLGQAVFGLAYQPGRYVNPGQALGLGSPLGAVGLVVFAGLLFWVLAVRPPPFEATVVIALALSLLLWFALSQQSRYIATLAVPACMLAGGAIARRGVGAVFVGAAVVIQAGVTLYLDKTYVFDSASQVALHKVEEHDFLKASFGSYQDAVDKMNELPVTSKVALYDQVFGFYLDVPYFWANPPHCTVIDYDSMKSGNDYVSAMQGRGFTHAYIQFVDPKTDKAFAAALGLSGPAIPLPPDLETAWKNDWIQVWKLYFIQAVASGQLKLVSAFTKGVLYEFAPMVTPSGPSNPK